MILPPKRPSFRRARRLFRLTKSMSILRALEKEALQELHLVGPTLDVGGGRHSSYRNDVVGYERFHCLNIDSVIRPNIIADAERNIPISDGVYENVFSANTLEHVFRDSHVVAECFRVLKPGGTFVAIVPFLFWVHGAPRDFHRHTADCWEELLRGIEAVDIRIRPLVWTPATSAISLLQRMRGVSLLTRVLILISGLLEMRFSESSWVESRADEYSRYALGYVVTGRKPSK